MTWYRRIYVTSEPYEIGLDDLHRIRFVFNIMADKAASNTFPQEVFKILVTEGVGTLGTNIFLGSAYTLPKGDGPYLQLIQTAGREPDETQNQISTPAYVRPAAQIVVRGKSYAQASSMVNLAYNALRGIVNRNVNP